MAKVDLSCLFVLVEIEFQNDRELSFFYKSPQLHKVVKLLHVLRMPHFQGQMRSNAWPANNSSVSPIAKEAILPEKLISVSKLKMRHLAGAWRVPKARGCIAE